jgi:drug/metabolite transporter (DMT)-like permease
VIALLLASVAAVGWGASDYFGGGVSHRATPVFVVVAVSETIGLALLAPVLIAHGVAPPASPRLALAALAGVTVTVELSLIYVALGRGEAFVTAPVGALGAAGAVAIGLIGGDPLDLGIAAGLVLALSGSAIGAGGAGRPGGRRASLRGGASALAAGAALATTLTCLHAAGRVDPYWATAIEHASTALSAALAAIVSRRGALPARSELAPLALIAGVGVSGDLAYALASRSGALSLVAAVSALYPVATIALGRVLRGVRAGRAQSAGVVLALAGAALLGLAMR